MCSSFHSRVLVHIVAYNFFQVNKAIVVHLFKNLKDPDTFKKPVSVVESAIGCLPLHTHEFQVFLASAANHLCNLPLTSLEVGKFEVC